MPGVASGHYSRSGGIGTQARQKPGDSHPLGTPMVAGPVGGRDRWARLPAPACGVMARVARSRDGYVSCGGAQWRGCWTPDYAAAGRAS